MIVEKYPNVHNILEDLDLIDVFRVINSDYSNGDEILISNFSGDNLIDIEYFRDVCITPAKEQEIRENFINRFRDVLPKLDEYCVEMTVNFGLIQWWD